MNAKEIAERIINAGLPEFTKEFGELAQAHLALLAKWDALDEPTDIMVVEGAKQINKPLQLSVQRARNSFKAMIAKAKE